MQCQKNEESEQIVNLIGDVRTGSEEQVRGLEQIAKAVSMFEEVTQRNSATAEHNAAAAGKLSGQSYALRSIAENLSVMVG